MALEKLSFFAYVISGKRANQQNQLRNGAFRVMKQVSLLKIRARSAKIKIDPKCYIRPFCTKAFNCNLPKYLTGWQCKHVS